MRDRKVRIQIRHELTRLPSSTHAESAAWLERHAKADHSICDKVSGEPVCAVYLAPRWHMAAENAQVIRDAVRNLSEMLWESDPEGMAAGSEEA